MSQLSMGHGYFLGRGFGFLKTFALFSCSVVAEKKVRNRFEKALNKTLTKKHHRIVSIASVNICNRCSSGRGIRHCVDHFFFLLIPLDFKLTIHKLVIIKNFNKSIIKKKNSDIQMPFGKIFSRWEVRSFVTQKIF